MRALVWKANLRHLLHHPWQLGLAILGVALGVAVVVGIDVANGSAARAFQLASETVAGKATHAVIGPGGELPEEIYPALRLELGLRLSAPVVEGEVTLPDRPGRRLTVLGVDPFAEAPFRQLLTSVPRGSLDLGDFLTRPGAALLTPATAAELEVEAGSEFEVDVGGAVRRLELVGFLEAVDGTESVALNDLAVVDIASAQEMLGLVGRLSRIDLIRPDSVTDDELASKVEPLLSPGAELVTVRSRTSTVAQMTRAFELNLQALSLLALLCGAFLIYNTMTFAVVQRRPLIAMLRALGTTRRQVFVLVLSEALLIGVVGTLIGGLLGIELGRGLIERVTQTINDLYFAVTVREVAVAPWTLVKGALLGLSATVAASLAPALEATSTQPREALARSELEARVHRAVPLLTILGLLLLAAGCGLLLLPGESLWLGFTGLFAVLLGFALLTPILTLALMAALTPLAGAIGGQLGRMATRGVVTALSRTGIAVAALMMALSVTVGVDLMVRSFRGTVTRWLDYALPADLYLSVFSTPAQRFAPGGATIDRPTVEAIAELDGVAAVNALRHFLVEADGDSVRAVAIELAPQSYGAFSFRSGDGPAIWRRLELGEAVIVSEPLAYRSGLAEGDTLEITTPDHVLALPVAGVFYDYSSEQGLLMLGRDLYRRAWSDDGVTALSIHLGDGSDTDELKAKIGRLLPADLRVRTSSNRELKSQSLRIFDRTFVITGVLRTLAVIVAFVGVLSALLALQLERTRELGVMRACGLTPGQLWGLVTQQTGLMGLTAGLLSLPVGVAMAAIMIYVINRRSFGWTLEMALFPQTLIEAVALGVGAALAAGLYPAWRMARTRPAVAVREE